MSFLLLPFLDLFKHLTELSCLLSMLLYALLITQGPNVAFGRIVRVLSLDSAY